MKNPSLRLSQCLAVTVTVMGLGSLGACTVSVEADVPDIEVTQHDVAFSGIPLAGRLGDVATELTFMQDKPSLGLPKEIDTSVKAVQVELTARTGITTFDFLRSLRVTMAPNDGSSAPVELINYEKVGSGSVGGTLSIPSQNPVNILDQWKTDSAKFTVQLEGVLPEQDWTVDLRVHFAGKLSYKL
jgi:hypothetical protein